ncbi:MAG: sigma factor, partial [Pseudomonadota bacterium]
MTKPGCDPALERFLPEREDLIALARTVVGCPSVAEDLVQDCWLRWRAKAYPSDKARPILMRIVKNLAIDWHRRRKREADGLETQKLHWAEAPDTERIVGARQELALVVRALSECPERTVYA